MSTHSKKLEKNRTQQRAHTPTDTSIKKIIPLQRRESLLYVAPQFITHVTDDDELSACFVTGYN